MFRTIENLKKLSVATQEKGCWYRMHCQLSRNLTCLIDASGSLRIQLYAELQTVTASNVITESSCCKLGKLFWPNWIRIFHQHCNYRIQSIFWYPHLWELSLVWEKLKSSTYLASFLQKMLLLQVSCEMMPVLQEPCKTIETLQDDEQESCKISLILERNLQVWTFIPPTTLQLAKEGPVYAL